MFSRTQYKIILPLPECLFDCKVNIYLYTSFLPSKLIEGQKPKIVTGPSPYINHISAILIPSQTALHILNNFPAKSRGISSDT